MKFEKITEEEAWEMLFKKIQDPLTERIVFDTTETDLLCAKNNKNIENEIDVCEALNKCITEELGISDNVKQTAIYLIGKIKESIRTSKITPINYHGVIHKHNSFSETIFNKKTTIEYDFINYENKELCNLYNDELKKTLKAKNKSISNYMYLYIISIDNYIMPHTLDDTIYHELEHIFQQNMMGKPFSSANLYQLALELKESNNVIAKCVGNIIYLSTKYEQDAYINGLYGLLKAENDINYCVKTSDVYQALILLKEYYKTLSSIDRTSNDFVKVMELLKPYNINYNKLIKKCNDSINIINRKIARVIAKYRNENPVVYEHEIIRYSPFFKSSPPYHRYLINPYYIIK